ncbi:MAG: hypothetical protein LBK91_04380 [Synergistaceae bacterium]|nr:hypothetical protein [Synergistaceae bacterium]
MKNFDDYIGEMIETITNMAESYGLMQAPGEDAPGYAERVRLRARLSSVAALMHWMAIDLASLDGIMEEARRAGARHDCVRATRHMMEALSIQPGAAVSVPHAPSMPYPPQQQQSHPSRPVQMPNQPVQAITPAGNLLSENGPEEETERLTVTSINTAQQGEMTYAEYAQMLAGHLRTGDDMMNNAI